MHVDVSVFHAKLLHLDVCPSIYHTSLKEWYVFKENIYQAYKKLYRTHYDQHGQNICN